MKKRAFPVGLLAVSTALVGCWPAEHDAASTVVAMHPALRVFGDDDGWEEDVRLRLGCNPCERISNVNFRDPSAVYLFNPHDPMTLVLSDVESALIGSARRMGAPSTHLLWSCPQLVERGCWPIKTSGRTHRP